MHLNRQHLERWRGSIYLHVLASSLLVTILGLGSLAAVRIQMRSARLSRDCAQARMCALSAVELGIFCVRQDPNWRSTQRNGFWLHDKPLGDGTLTLEGIDPGDGVLDDSPCEPLVLTGTGTRGLARHKTQVTLMPVVKPLAALGTALTASGQILINTTKRISVSGACISTNADLMNNGTIDGDVEAQSIGRQGTVTGTLTVPGPWKSMPAANVFTIYADKATPIPYSSIMENLVLGPGCNPFGAPDPNGLYVINTGGHNLTLRNCRVCGTLVVLAGGLNVTIADSVLLQNCRPDSPTLLVDGYVMMGPTSATTELSEAACGVNFNPVGAPYNGVTDSDTTDVYVNEIQGLVHVKGGITLQNTARIVGVLICEGQVTGSGDNTIIYNPALYAIPPQGYTFVEGMTIAPDSWKQVVD